MAAVTEEHVKALEKVLMGVRGSERGEGRVAREGAYVPAEFVGGRYMHAASRGGYKGYAIIVYWEPKCALPHQ